MELARMQAAAHRFEVPFQLCNRLLRLSLLITKFSLFMLVQGPSNSAAAGQWLCSGHALILQWPCSGCAVAVWLQEGGRTVLAQ